MKPLCIDLFCGLGGWSEGFMAEGWDCVGFDITRHSYKWVDCVECDGTGNFYRHDEDGDFLPCEHCYEKYGGERAGTVPERYPGQLVLQDILTLHGSQFRNAGCIVASPPCQEFSYMAMPWSRAKQIAAALRNEGPFPAGYTGSCIAADLTALFDACFRIQREACEAAGRHIPLVVENVKGAQRWVGKARANFGSFYLWGDVDSVGGRIIAGRPRFGVSVQAARRGSKGKTNLHVREKSGGTVPSPSWHGAEHEASVAAVLQSESGSKGFVTGLGMGHDWRQDPSARFNSKSDSRRAASAEIAKIPLALSRHVAGCFHTSKEPLRDHTHV